MGYSVKYSRSAEKYLDRQTDSARKRIIAAIDALPNGDVIKLTNRPGFRLVVGGYRVLFEHIGEDAIDVITIAPRGDAYKK